MKKKSRQYRAISVKFLEKTGRIKFEEQCRSVNADFLEKKDSVKFDVEWQNHQKIIALNPIFDSVLDQAVDCLAKNGLKVIGHCEMKDRHIIFCDIMWGSCIRIRHIN